MPGKSHRGALDAALLIAALLFPSAAAWLYFVSYAASPILPALYAGCKVAQFLLPVVWLLVVARRLPGRLPFAARGLTAGAVSGVALGAAVVIFYLTMVRGTELATLAGSRITARLEALNSATPLRFLALALFLSVLHSFLEEYYWRWFAFDRLRDYVRSGWAVTISSAAFAAHHVIVLHAFIGSGSFWWATVLFSIAVAGAGALWARQYRSCRSLLPVWLSHTLVDLAIMTVGYDLVWPFT